MIKFRNLTIIPTYHSNLDFVQQVRKVFYEDPPDAIAVEFPENLREKILQGIDRLPRVSIILYFDHFLEHQLFIPIFGGDSLIEAIRLGREYGIPVEFIDLFVKNYAPETFNMPDSFVLTKIPLDEFYNIVDNELKFEQNAKLEYKVMDLKSRQQKAQDIKNADLLESEARKYIGEDDAEAWLKDSHEIDWLRDRFMASNLANLMKKHKKVLVIMGLAHWARIRILLENEDISDDLPSLNTSVETEIYNVDEQDLTKIFVETPNIVFQYEVFRMKQKEAIDEFDEFHDSFFELVKFDHFNAIKIILQRSLFMYEEQYHETVNMHKLKSLFQYIRNLPLVDGMIKPHLFEIVLGAKSIVNDDFAWIVWEECKFYPDAQESDDLETLHFTEQGIFLHGKYFRLRRYIPMKIRKIKIPLKPKPKETKKGEWRENWNKNRWNLVSYLPEDLFEENYFQHVRIRSLGLMKDQNRKIHKFNSTLMDGIAFRETIRDWPFKHQIYVKEERPIRGQVDAVVIIFDRDDTIEEQYPYNMMWYAEHEQESDLALYSSFPGIELVGPGISRIELGGVVSFFPPRGVPDIWTENFERKYVHFQEFWINKADRLLLAALLYSQKKFISYIAASPPNPRFIHLASRFGQKIIYIPHDRFNPVSLRALRNLHILAGKEAREYAHKYIKKRRY